MVRIESSQQLSQILCAIRGIVDNVNAIKGFDIGHGYLLLPLCREGQKTICLAKRAHN
ncbi:hypothetical protein D3C77_259530 [compost metagenome]